jgi:hypothetical protein
MLKIESFSSRGLYTASHKANDWLAENDGKVEVVGITASGDDIYLLFRWIEDFHREIEYDEEDDESDES